MWVTKIKASPFWYARFNHPDPTKPVVSISTKCTNRRQALARGRELEEEFIDDWKRHQGGAAMSSKRVIDEFWEADAQHLKAAVTHVFPHLNRIDQFLGDKPYCLVTIADAARFSDQMQAEGFSPSTINRALSVWRRMHNLAGKKRLYPVKLIDWSALRKTEPPPRDAHLTPDQIRAIFIALPQKAREIAMFGLLVGLRKSQVLTLEWDRVDIDGGTITVFRKNRKTQARHTIPIHDAALAILIERRRLGNYNATGAVFDVTNFRKFWESAISTAGLTGKVRFHDLRHAFATAAAQTTPVHLLKELLGHSDVKVTMRYTHARAGDMRAALKRLPVIDL